MFKPGLGVSAFALLSMSLGSVVFAQETDKDTEELKEDQNVDKIVVVGQRSYYERNATSATRLDIPIIETPQSIFVINADLIADQQAFRFDQVLQNDSSVQKANNFLGAYSSYQVRGFSISNTTNYLRDGRAFFHLASAPVEVLDRVEVLKGPSSVLYGTLAPGGLINMIPKRPFYERQTTVKATFGSYDIKHVHVDHGGPIIESGNIRFRVNGVYEDTNSFRVFNDGSEFNTKRYTAAAAVDWDISNRTFLRVNFDFTRDQRPQDIGLVNLTGDFSNQSRTLIYNQPWTKYDSDVWNVAAELTHEFSDHLQLRTGISHQNFIRDRYDNQVRSAPNAAGDVLVRARRRINRRDYSTFYVDWIGKFRTGFIEHQVLIGADHTAVGIDNNETARNFTFLTNIFNPVILPDPQIVTRDAKNLGSEDRSGIYFHDMISFGEKWRVLIGARYDDFDSEFKVGSRPVRQTRKATNLTPRLGILYLPAPEISIYGSFSQSFEPNSPVRPPFSNAGDILDPTKGEQFEVGVKWEALGGRLLTTGAVFTIDRKDAPFEDILANTVVQRGKQTHKGAELTVAGIVGDNWSLTGSATYLSAEFTEDDNPSLIGNIPRGVPKWAVSFGTEYAFLGGSFDGLSIQGGWFYESERQIDDANTYTLGAYNRFDAGLKYVFGSINSDLDWVARLTVQNLTNTEYYKGRTPFSVNPERPREIRTSIEVNF